MLNSFSLLSLLLFITTAEIGSLPERVRTTLPAHVIAKLNCWSVQQGVCFRAVSDYVGIFFFCLFYCLFVCLFVFKENPAISVP